MEVVAMSRLVGEDKAAAANKTPITADKRGDKKERKKERGCAHIHDEVTRVFILGFSLLAWVLTSFTLSFTLVPVPLCNLCDLG